MYWFCEENSFSVFRQTLLTILLQMPPLGDNSYKDVVVEWKENLKLKQFLSLKCGDKDSSFTFLQILRVLKRVILEEKLYDPGNLSIILRNEELEDALDRKALHVCQLRDAITSHLANSVEINFPEIIHTKTSIENGNDFLET